MKSFSGKNPAVSQISSHIKTQFPKLTLSLTEYRSSADFRSKGFRLLSLSENTIFELNRAKKSFPDSFASADMALKISAEFAKPTFQALLAFFYDRVQLSFETFAVNLIVYTLLLKAEEEARTSPESRSLARSLESSLVKDLDILKIKVEQQEFDPFFLESKLLRPLLNNICWKFGSLGIVQKLKGLINLPTIDTFLVSVLCKMEAQACRNGESVPPSRKNSASIAEPLTNLVCEKQKLSQKQKRHDSSHPSEKEDVFPKQTRENFFFNSFIKPNEKAERGLERPTMESPAKTPSLLLSKIRKAPLKGPKGRSIKVVLNRSKTNTRSKTSFNCQSTIDHSHQEILKQESLYADQPSAGKGLNQTSASKKQDRQVTTSISEFVFGHEGLVVEANWEEDFNSF